MRCGWVYPRVCGGTDLLTDEALDRVGLSLRVRGNRGGPDFLRHRVRSIPACAGEPRWRRQ